METFIQQKHFFMKNIFLTCAAILILNGTGLFAQQYASFQVSGNCGMCKSRIEKAAKEAGAAKAIWNEDSKQLNVSFASNTSVEAIQKKIAAVGHDNAGAKASDEVYNKLHGCCQYERSTAAAQATDKAPCCKAGESCKQEGSKVTTPCCDKPCCKDGKCAHCGDCCKEGKCTKSGDCCQAEKMANCCKDGKCSMPGHNGKDCCKKS